MIWIVLVLIWYLWFYSSDELDHLIDGFIEKDYPFLVSHTSKKTYKKAFFERVLVALLFSSGVMIAGYVNGLFAVILFVLIYLLQYQLLKRKYERKLKEASLQFPYLLDRIASLVQSNTIPVSIYKAIPNAPILFRKDLLILIDEIHHDGSSLQPYLNFANKFHQIEDIESIMRSLYSLSIIGSKESGLLSFCSVSNSKLIKRKEIELENSLDLFNLYSFVLYAAMGVLLLGLFSTMNFFSL